MCQHIAAWQSSLYKGLIVIFRYTGHTHTDTGTGMAASQCLNLKLWGMGLIHETEYRNRAEHFTCCNIQCVFAPNLYLANSSLII